MLLFRVARPHVMRYAMRFFPDTRVHRLAAVVAVFVFVWRSGTRRYELFEYVGLPLIDRDWEPFEAFDDFVYYWFDSLPVVAEVVAEVVMLVVLYYAVVATTSWVMRGGKTETAYPSSDPSPVDDPHRPGADRRRREPQL